MEPWRISSSMMEAIYLRAHATIIGVYIVAGISGIQTTGLSNSVSPLVTSLFLSCFVVVPYYSFFRWFFVTSRTRALFADVSRQLVEPARKYLVDDSAVEFFHLVLFLFSCSSLVISHVSPIGASVFLIPWPLFLFYQRCFHSHWMKMSRRFLDSSSLDPFTTWLHMYHKTNFLLPSITDVAATAGQERNKKKKKKKIVETIKFAVGTMGSILFQNYFKLNSFQETLAFIYLAVAWLASISLLSLSNDFGVFNFILGNVVVGSTVAESGLGPHTWLAFAVSLLLFCLSLELKSLPYIRERNYIRANIVICILFIILYYGIYLVLFVYRTHILSVSRPFFV